MTKEFLADTAVRALKTFAQAVLALMTTGSVGITSLDWVQVLNVAGAAALASVLTSVTSLSNVGTASTGKHVDNLPVIVGQQASPVIVGQAPPVETTPTV